MEKSLKKFEKNREFSNFFRFFQVFEKLSGVNNCLRFAAFLAKSGKMMVLGILVLNGGDRGGKKRIFGAEKRGEKRWDLGVGFGTFFDVVFEVIFWVNFGVKS